MEGHKESRYSPPYVKQPLKKAREVVQVVLYDRTRAQILLVTILMLRRRVKNILMEGLLGEQKIIKGCLRQEEIERRNINLHFYNIFHQVYIRSKQKHWTKRVKGSH